MTIYEKLNNYIKELSFEFDEDIKQFHIDRTKRHIESVKYFYEGLIYGMYYKPSGPAINIDDHDSDKLLFEEQILPYCLINWKYECKLSGIDYIIPEEFADECHNATVRHVKFGNHHPEFWDPNQEDLISKDNRDGVSRIIDGTRMPLERIEEMAADICAVAKERGNTPQSWVEKNLYKRWNLTPEAGYLLIHSVNKMSINK